MHKPVLQHPNFKERFIVATDASDYAFCAILSQDINGEEHKSPMLVVRWLLPS